MGHFSVEIYAPPGSDLSGNQQLMTKKTFDRPTCYLESYLELNRPIGGS